MAKRLIPTFNRVLVEKLVPPSKTTAGILLPEKSSKVFSISPFLYVSMRGCICEDGFVIWGWK